MILTNKIAKKTINFIRKNTSLPEEDLEKIDYGIKVIVSNFFKLVILFLSAYFLGVLKYTLLALVVFGTIRSFACGVHANSTLQCIIINYICFLGSVYLGLYLPLNNFMQFIIFFISLIILIAYAPADTAERPLVSKKLRKHLKFLSILAATILFFISLYINNYVYKSIILYSILQASLATMPLFYKLFGKTYSNYSNITL